MTKIEKFADELLRIGLNAACDAGETTFDRNLPWPKIDKPIRVGWIAVAKYVQHLIDEGKK
jgi:hypothetical protein